jgi:hypothetical protein
VIALEDGALAIVLIAASRLADESDRVALLERFAATADPPRPRADQLRKIPQLSGGRAGVVRRRRSRAAENQRRYRARDRDGVRIFRFPLSHEDLEFFARARWLPDEKLADHDAVVNAVLRELRALRARYR